MLTREKIYALTGSIIGCIALFLILWFIYMPAFYTDNILDEGVMVSFGDAFDGGGNDMSVQDVYAPPATAQTPTTAQKLPSEQDIMTQKSVSPVKVAENKNKTDIKAQELALQREAEQRRIAEQQRREQEAIDRANNTMSGLFGNSGGSGSGNTRGDTRQGNPAGKGTSGGNSWSLNGRDLIGSLVRPSYSSNEEGKITVSIRVDKSGNVTSATVVSPTTISDAETRSGAITAARQTKFSGGSGVVVGTITYFYRLN
ncbi:TonB family protein [uncultured Paludibacter sp.]|nr:TonB family protein [uncultured Paludibacter sp.]